jgi:hypothetical protein
MVQMVENFHSKSFVMKTLNAKSHGMRRFQYPLAAKHLFMSTFRKNFSLDMQPDGCISKVFASNAETRDKPASGHVRTEELTVGLHISFDQERGGPSHLIGILRR